MSEIYEEARLRALYECAEPLSPRRTGGDERKRRFWRELDRRWGDHAPVRLLPLLDPRPDRLLASLPLEKIAAGASAGLVRPVKERPIEEYPAELDTQMEFKEPQYFLRNIPRVERIPDDPLEFDRTALFVRDWHAVVQAVHRQRREPVQLIEELNEARVREYRQGTRRLFFQTDWTRHFGKELAATVDGPLWKYDPDAPKEADR